MLINVVDYFTPIVQAYFSMPGNTCELLLKVNLAILFSQERSGRAYCILSHGILILNQKNLQILDFVLWVKDEFVEKSHIKIRPS